MKIVIIDTSYNSSLSKVEVFLDHNEEADMVCTFDAMSWENSPSQQI